MTLKRVIAILLSFIVSINATMPVMAETLNETTSMLLEAAGEEDIDSLESNVIEIESNFEDDQETTVSGTYNVNGTNINLKYMIIEEQIKITDCNVDAAGLLEIPTEIEGYPVKIIGESAFLECMEITAVVVPDSVKIIETSAFESCEAIKNITLSKNLQDLGNAAFKYCRVLSEIDLPDSLTYIPDNAFEGCWELGEVGFPEYMTSIGEEAFYLCITLNDVVIPEGVESIGYKAFCQCGQQVLDGYSFTAVTLPSTIRNIGEKAFASCESLKTVNFPEGLLNIGDFAFAGCYNLESVSLPIGLEELGKCIFSYCKVLDSANLPDDLAIIPDGLFNCCYSLSEISIPESVHTIGSNAFTGCPLKIVQLPDALLSIGREAFYNCENLVEVIYPEGLQELGDRAYADCISLTSVVVPDKVTSLSGTFDGCTGITSVILPKNLTYLGDATFRKCSALTEIQIPETVTALGNSVFSGCTGLSELFLSENIKSIGSGAFSGCKGISEFVLPSSLTEISDSLFGSCRFTSITLPSGIKSIGNSSFSGCTNLTEITIPEGVTSIGENAFQNCTALIQVNLASTITSIGGAAFSGCTEIVTINIPDGVKVVEDLTFYECVNLKNVFLPDELESIGYKVFERCSSLQRITLPETLKTIGHYAFRRTALDELFIPDSVVKLGSNVFDTCGIEKVRISEAITEIDYMTFANSGLTGVRIPDNVVLIDGESFYGCSYLTYASLPGNLDLIEQQAFASCSQLKEICFRGAAPAEIRADSFANVTATVYYPLDDETWTEDIKQNYGGTLTWKACEPELMPTPSVEPENTIVVPQDTGVVYQVNYATETVAVIDCTEEVAGVITLAKKIEGYPVTVISENAFENSALVTTLILPDTLTEIDENAFKNCSVLSVVRFEGSAPDIAENAFENVIAAVHYPEGNATWTEDTKQNYGGTLTWYGYSNSNGPVKPGDSGTYKQDGSNAGLTYTVDAGTGEAEIISCNTDATGTVIIPSDIGGYPVTNIGEYAFEGANIESVELSDGLKTIGYCAFYFCTKLKTVKLPEKTLTEIEDGAFYGCNKLTAIYIPDSVVRIGISAFDRCTVLADVRMPATLDELGGHAFKYCSNLTEIVIPNGVDCIANYTFCECKKLYKVTIPETVTSIEQYAFDLTSALTDVYYEGTRAQWEAINIAEDNEPLLNATIHCQEIFEIVKQPESQWVQDGRSAVFKVQATGQELSYQWQYSKNGEYWYNSGLTGSNTATLTVEALEKRDGQQYRCVITDGNENELVSEVAILTIEEEIPAIVIITQPKSQTAEMGTSVIFNIEAEGEAITYQWQYSTSGGKYWFNSGMEGAQTASLTVPVTEKRNNQQYRCVITDGTDNEILSEVAVLTVREETAIVIINQPTDRTGTVGENIIFTVEAEGENLTYQWQYSKNGEYWFDSGMEGAQTESLIVPVTEKRNNQQYRCVITDSNTKEEISETAVLTVKEETSIVIISQPLDQSGAVGENVMFTVEAEGEELTYQWQYSTNGGKYWFDSGMKGAQTASLDVDVIEKRDGQQYKCLIKDINGNEIETTVVTLYVN